MINSSSPGQNGRQFGRRHFQMLFLEWKYMNFEQFSSLGSDNGYATTRRQAIIWTNVDPVHRGIYAALGGDELNGTQMHLLEVISSTTRQLMPKRM